MKSLEINAAISAYARHARRGKPVILTVKGKPAYVLAKIDPIDVEDLTLVNSPAFWDSINRSRASLATHGGIPADELRKRLGIKPRRRP